MSQTFPAAPALIRICLTAFLTGLTLAAANPAHALPSDVDSPRMTAGDLRVQQRIQADPSGPGVQWRHETSVTVTPANWVSLQIGLETRSRNGAGLAAEGLELEAEFATPALNTDDLRLGLEVAHTTGFRGEPDEIALKAIAGAQAGALRWSANLIAERERGAAWTTEYAARIEAPLGDGVLWAVELLGDVDPGAERANAHVVGAAARWTWADVQVEPAAFVGLTQNSPNVLFRLTLRAG